jgi:hypothetical protein
MAYFNCLVSLMKMERSTTVWIGRGSERRKSLHRKSKKEHRKSKTSLLDQNVKSLTSTVIKIKNYLWRFHPMSLG